MNVVYIYLVVWLCSFITEKEGLFLKQQKERNKLPFMQKSAIILAKCTFFCTQINKDIYKKTF